MNKRLAYTLLWLYVGWTLGALVASTVGLSSILGPITAVGTVILFAAAPRGFRRMQP